MKVSVIIPAYNAEKYLSKCLDSIINQIYKNIEIIIIDDASTDNTKRIIKEYALRDDRIIPFYSTINKGVSASRNIGLSSSTGDYVMFVDSDDEITRDCIRRMVDLSNKYNSDYVDSYHLLKYTKDNGKICSFTEKKVPKVTIAYGSLNDNIKILNLNTYITGKLLKRDLIKNLKFDEDLRRYEDLVFEHNLKKHVKNYILINKVTYTYYQHEDSLINSLGKKHLAYLDAAKKVKDIYSDSSTKIQKEIEALLFRNMILTLFTKVIKNNDSNMENTKLASDVLNELINIFPKFMDNDRINKLIKKKVNVFLADEDKLYKFIKKMSKKNFIKIYFNVLSKINKYEIKDLLL